MIRGSQLSVDGGFRFDDLVFVSDEKADRHSGNLAFPGDVIVTQRGTLGQVGIIPIDCDYPRLLLSQSQMKITADPEVADPHFLYYSLIAPGNRQRLVDYAMSAGVPHINLATLREFELQFPPLEVQRVHAAILRTVDDLIENNRRRIALLEQMAQAIYREWFVHFRYPGHEDDELVDSPFGQIPGGWETSDVWSETLNFDRLRKPLSRRERSERPGGFPYYGAARVIDSIDNYLFDGDYLLVAEDGSVVTEAGFPILQRVRGQFWVSNHAHVLQGAGRVTTTFLELALEEYPIMGHVTGAAQPKVTQANLNRIRLLVPPSAQSRLWVGAIRSRALT